MLHVFRLIPLLFVLLAPFAARAETPRSPAGEPVAATAQTGRPTELLAFGTEDQYWIAVTRTAEEGKTMTLIRQRGTAAGADGWRPFARYAGAQILDLSARRDELLVLLRTGSETQLRSVFRAGTGASSVTLPAPPSGRELLAIAADGDAVLAVVAPAVEDPAVTRPTTSEAEATPWPAGVVLARLERRQWQPIAAVPAPEDVAARDVSLTSLAGVPMVGVREGPDLRVLTWNAAAEEWNTEVSFALPLADHFKLFDDDSQARAYLFLAGGENGADRLSVREAGGSWAEPFALEIPASEGVAWSPTDLRTAVSALGAVRYLRTTMEGADYEVGVDAVGGRVLADTLVKLEPPATQSGAQQILNIVVYTLLAVAFIAILRQRPITAERQVADVVQRLAPVGLRLAAGAVDTLPLFLAAGLWFGGPPGVEQQALDFFAAACLAVWLLHPMIAEYFFGRTLGKTMFGLMVVQVDGRPVTLRGVILRNLLRPLDWMPFGLPIALVVVLFTPLRQRLGDMAGGTTVIHTHADHGDGDERVND